MLRYFKPFLADTQVYPDHRSAAHGGLSSCHLPTKRKARLGDWLWPMGTASAVLSPMDFCFIVSSKFQGHVSVGGMQRVQAVEKYLKVSNRFQ